MTCRTLEHIQKLANRMDIEFNETCDSIVAAGGSTKVLHVKSGLDSLNGTRFPVIVSKVNRNSDAVSAGVRRGMIIVSALSRTGQRLPAADICSSEASITVLRPTPEISLASSIFDPTRTFFIRLVQCYVQT